MKKVDFCFYSAKGYYMEFTHYFSEEDFLKKMLDDLNVLTTFVNTKEDFDIDRISKITIEY